MQRFDSSRDHTPLEEEQAAPRTSVALQKRAESQAAQRADVDAHRGVQATATEGVSGGGVPLPHREQIQAAFGKHDISDIQAHIGGAAAEASDAIGAEAYATTTPEGRKVAFKEAPDPGLAAHEAAHMVQQKSGVQLAGGVGAVGDVYERNADAVADAVVQGRSAERLLDPFAGGGGGGGVQRAVVQRAAIKDDLDEAMDGWGTDEEAIYSRLRRATAVELRAVIGDTTLMGRLRDELTHSEMVRVLDLLDAPLADKISLAIEGWGTDEGYIWRSLNSAPMDQLTAFAGNATAFAALLDDLNDAEEAQARGIIARRIHATGAVDTTIDLLRRGSEPIVEWMNQFGSLTAQRLLCDAVITAGSDIERVKAAFQHYWDVDLEKRDTVDDAGVKHVATEWTFGTLQRVHAELKRLPEQDARSQVFLTLVRLANSTGGSMQNHPAASTYGEFELGEDVETTPDQEYGVGTRLRVQAAGGQKELLVDDSAVFQAGDTVAVGPRPSADVHPIAAVDTSNHKYTLAANLSKTYAKSTRVTPDDDTAMRDVVWLEALVRHEIAHAIDPEVGASGFNRDMGGWWAGADFDTWANKMGSPWNTSDGSTISDAEKKEIKDHIVAQMTGNGGKALDTGLPATHAIKKYWDSDVPVIEAAKPCVAAGKTFWQAPQALRSYNGHYFSINHYYHQLQYYRAEVQTNRVRAYSIFAPAEFFAEVYTVYYEEAGSVPDEQLGRLVPVASWRQWITDNVHNRGKSPTEAQAGGKTSPQTGMQAGRSG